MNLIALKDAPALFGVGRTNFMTLKKYDPEFPPVRGQLGRGFAFDIIELAEYFAKKYPKRAAPGYQMALEAHLKPSKSAPEV